PLGHVRTAVIGELEDPPAVALLGLHQAFVLERLERGVHRARARVPGAVASRVELLHDLVAVHGRLVEQRQDAVADVAPGRPRAPEAPPGMAAHPLDDLVVGYPAPPPRPAASRRERRLPGPALEAGPSPPLVLLVLSTSVHVFLLEGSWRLGLRRCARPRTSFAMAHDI